MNRIRNLLKLLLAREELPEAPAAEPRVRPQRPGLGALLFRIEPLPTDPEAKPEPAGRARRGLGQLLLGIDELPVDPEAPKASGGGPGLWRTLFAIDSLPADPPAAPRPARPYFTWLLWPESLSSSDPKKPGEN